MEKKDLRGWTLEGSEGGSGRTLEEEPVNGLGDAPSNRLSASSSVASRGKEGREPEHFIISPSLKELNSEVAHQHNLDSTCTFSPRITYVPFRIQHSPPSDRSSATTIVLHTAILHRPVQSLLRSHPRQLCPPSTYTTLQHHIYISCPHPGPVVAVPSEQVIIISSSVWSYGPWFHNLRTPLSCLPHHHKQKSCAWFDSKNPAVSPRHRLPHCASKGISCTWYRYKK